MPTYEYRCRDCSYTFDVVQAMSDETLTVCPVCGGELRKVFAAPAISFKGSGFYATDHGKKSKSEKADEKSGEKTAASTESSEKKSETKDKKSETKDKKESSKPAEKTVAPASAASGSSDSGSTVLGSDGKERSS